MVSDSPGLRSLVATITTPEASRIVTLWMVGPWFVTARLTAATAQRFLPALPP